MTLLSDLDQSNLRRGYDGKCRNCPRMLVGGLVGCQDRLCVNSDADEVLAKWERRYAREVLPHRLEKT